MDRRRLPRTEREGAPQADAPTGPEVVDDRVERLGTDCNRKPLDSV